MATDWKGLVEAVAAGIAGASMLLAVIIFFFRDKFFNMVELTFTVRGPAIKESIEKLFEQDISNREEWVEEIRRNKHSIMGLDTIMQRHEIQLTAMQSVPALVKQHLELMQEVKAELKENRDQIAQHAVDLGRLIERRNQSRGD